MSLRKLPRDQETLLKKVYELFSSIVARAKQVAKEIDPTKTYKEVIEDLKSDHLPNFQKVLEFTRNEAERAKEFVKSHDLAVFPQSNLDIVEAPPYLIPIIPYGGYESLPYFDKDQPGVYFVTPPQDEEDLKKHCYLLLSNTMVHEAYPGHHLDFVFNNVFAPCIRILGYSIEIIEIWAHYCEELILQQGFHKDLKKAELTILIDQIFRMVRIIVDIELHCKQRSIEDAIKMLIDEGQLEENAAKAEVLRYTSYPSFQLSYLVGKFLIQELRRELEEKMGDKFNLKFFHDAILRSGDLPYLLLKEYFEEKIKNL